MTFGVTVVGFFVDFSFAIGAYPFWRVAADGTILSYCGALDLEREYRIFGECATNKKQTLINIYIVHLNLVLILFIASTVQGNGFLLNQTLC